MSDKTAASVALAIYLVGGTLTFAWPLWWQRRRTGSTGFRGISGHLGPAEWFGGIGFPLSLIIAFTAPVLQLAGVVGPLPFLRATGIQVAGIPIAVAGIIGTTYAQMAMGNSWRIGVDDSETTALVRSGVFGLIRNPIYVGMFTFALGTILITPNAVAIFAYALAVVVIQLQVRLVEEPYLQKVHGASYREYASAVGRFVPHVGLIR
jgi:protein-S-isoprenylcysteine O-methyltransferase Ste14